MHLTHLSLHDFRSWPEAEVDLAPGPTAFVGRNGQGKTNLVEAVDYLARLGSHRVASDAPLVREGCERAVVRAQLVREERSALVELEINPGRSNRARVNRSPLPRTRELLGWVRSVLFSPEDLTLVKGDPGDRRRFLDDLLVQRTPRLAGTRADYERVLRQRTTLLRTAGGRGRGGSRGPDEHVLSTLDVWDDHLSRSGAELTVARVALVGDLQPFLGKAYEAVARGARRDDALATYQPSWPHPPTDGGEPTTEGLSTDVEQVRAALLAELGRRRSEELDRGVTLSGPHRDELRLSLGTLPVKGYASHGESWSFALALRLASFDLLRATGDDPVLILDDVFAELDGSRREQLADLVHGAEQVLVTAAVTEDVPAALLGTRYRVDDGSVQRDG